MSIQRHQTAQRMSKIVIHNDTVYLCGQVAEDRSADISEQTRTMLAKVDQLLESVGSGRDKLLSATVYLNTMEDFAAMNAVWDNWLPQGHAPARACVEAAMARPELKVEISVIAAL